MTETELADTQPLERKRTVPLQGAARARGDGRHRRGRALLAREPARADRQAVRPRGAGARRGSLGRGDAPGDLAAPSSRPSTPTGRSQKRAARSRLPADAEPTASQMKQAAESLLKRATEPLATKPALRTLLVDLKREFEQVDRRGVRRTSCSEAGCEPRGEGEGAGARRRLRAVHRGPQGRDRRAPVLLRAAVPEAAVVQGHQGAGRGHQGAAPRRGRRRSSGGPTRR